MTASTGTLPGADTNSKKSDSVNNQQLSYWCKLFEKPLCSPQEFYGLVEENLRKWDVPALKGGYVHLREGNAFSDKRLYLQLEREQLVFEVCAAPFGTGYFVSSRLYDLRKQATLTDYCVIAFALFLICSVVWYMYGLGIMAITALSILLVYLAFINNASAGVIRSLDDWVIRIPVVGPVYNAIFHPFTFYRADQNNMYQQAVHHAVMGTIDELNQKVGIKPLTAEERKPTIRQMFGN